MSDYYRLGTIIDTLQITFHLMSYFLEKQVFAPMFPVRNMGLRICGLPRPHWSYVHSLG